jgi:hypothetical protein
MDEMGIAVAPRQLDDAEPVAMGVEPHGLAVDSDDGPEIETGRKVPKMDVMGHGPGL